MTTVTMDMIEWRDQELIDTVDFLNVVNPHGYSVDEIKWRAYDAFVDNDYKPTFVGTGGWYVTFIPKNYESEKPWIALVSVMAYTAVRYMRDVERKEKENETC